MFQGVLIVDDNPSVRAALRDFLQKSTQVRVCGEAADGTEAIEKVKKHNPDLILMDLAMPGMNGVDAVRVLRKLMPDARIVVFSLYASLVDERLARAMGIDLVVPKTGGATGLLKALRPFLANHRSNLVPVTSIS
jgi:DNA-binding NarL/FixJ family response regulator